MAAHPTGRKKDARRLRTRALWLCLLTGMLAILIAIRSEVRSVLAQSSSPPAAPAQESASPAQDAGAQSGALEPAAKQDAQAPAEAVSPRNRIADDSANMLKLASRLKFEVDNTTADTLSITAIRDVQAIEKLAHKMRTQ